MDLDGNGEPIDAPDAPDYDDAPEQGLDEGWEGIGEWKTWPLWARLRLLRRLRTEGAGRPEQYVDSSLEWYLWLLLGGRGSGKSDEASRWSAEDGLRLPRLRFALVGRTFADVRDTMFEGETGLLALIPDFALRGGKRQRAYNRSLGELYLANGTKFKGFSAEKAAALRGPQHHRAWVDEASSWEDADVPNIVKSDGGLAPAVDTTMSNLTLGLRLTSPDGSSVRMVVSTTPKPNELTEFLAETAETKGQLRVLTTYSNLDNLDKQVRDIVLGMYEGTDVAAQELEGKILSSVKGAAWDDAAIAAARSLDAPSEELMSKTVIGIDPAVSSKDSSDETGLIAVRGYDWDDEHGELRRAIRVLEDRSAKISSARFAIEVCEFAESVEADEVVVEINNGMDFVTQAIITWVESEGGSITRRERKAKGTRTRNRISVEYITELPSGHVFVLKPVWQSVDKLTRAKTASVWWSRGDASHAEGLEKLEKQMTTYDGTAKKSPDRLDALTSAVAGFAVRSYGKTMKFGSPLNVDEAPLDEDAPKHPLLQEVSAPSSGTSYWSTDI